MRALLARFTSLGSYRCYERRVLLNLAALRAGGGALVALVLLVWEAPILGERVALVLAPCNGALWALLCADWIEHYARWLIFGFPYNPNVSARCELEHGNMPTNREAEPAWRATLFTRIAVGDDPGSGHYPYPEPSFLGRLRAMWRGAE